MIEKLLEFDLGNQTLGNLTSAQQVNAVSTQPYFLTGMIIILAILLLSWFIGGFTKVHPKSKKVCFQSWIHNSQLIPIIIVVIVALIWFILGLPFAMIG